MTEPSGSTGAQLLQGVQVVELSDTLAGARCGGLLAALGAQVTRFGGTTRLTASAATAQWLQPVLHAGKRQPELAELPRALAGADIVVAELALEDVALQAQVQALAHTRASLRADAVLLLLSANGLDATTPGCGLTAAAESGLSFAIGSPGLEPLCPPYDIAEHQTAVHGAVAALVALRGGLGSLGPVDVATRDVLAHLVGTLAPNYLPFGRPWRREGTRPSMSGGVYPCGLFPCIDGYVAVYCRGTAEWHAMLQAMGHPAWSQDPRFADPKVVATHHADEADGHLLPWLARFTRAELMALGMRHGFPVAPVRYVREALAEPHFEFRGSFAPVTATADGPALRVPAAPWRVQTPAAGPAAAAAPPRWAQPRRADPARVFEGLRVLDFSWVWSGPLVTSVLADLGAEVLKIEHPSRPDSLRLRARPLRNGVPFEGPPAGEINPWFNQLNHGKKSVLCDLQSDKGRAQLLQLVRDCDVVVENMRPGALADRGLGYAELSAQNPGLVMLSMSMGGQTGPLSQMKGYAGIMTSMAGLESIAGYASELPDAPFVGMTMTALGDPNGAAHGLVPLLAALHRRARTGQGAWIDLAQIDAILSVMPAPFVESQRLGHVPVRGNARPDRFPHGHYACAGDDVWLALSVQDDGQWARLCATLGAACAGWAGLDLAARQARHGAIDAVLRAWLRDRTADEALARLQPLGIACASVARYEAMMASDWRQRRGLTRTVEHPYLGPQDVWVPPWLFGARTAGRVAAAPLLGEHTAAVLGAALSSAGG